MLHFHPGSPAAIFALALCFALVLAFEFANGFHDTANAVATVIYTNSLKPQQAVLLSAFMNFLGVLLGGIAVAYALVELLPPDVLSPPNGDPAVPMLVALFSTALAWNIFTWWFGIPNSSSHCVIGSLIGVAVGDALVHRRGVGASVDWGQIWNVLRALLVSPILGFVGAGLLYLLVRKLIRDPHLYEAPHEGKPPAGWVRGLLILTCTGVSFSHGTNDGQKSIGLIMLTIIGLMPATFALNPMEQAGLRDLPHIAAQAQPLIERDGGGSTEAIEAAQRLRQAGAGLDGQTPPVQSAPQSSDPGAGGQPDPVATRSGIRAEIYTLSSALKAVSKDANASADDRALATRLRTALHPTVEYAPWWVRLLSAVCLGLGTMIGYKRIVHTLGERVGKAHLTPAQGASAELVGAVLIGTAGFTGLPVSTTHIITSGIAGTMVGSGAGINPSMLTRIGLAWLFTLPVTISVAAGLFYALAPK
jgi:PiT family inorganic phosphate transporter